MTKNTVNAAFFEKNRNLDFEFLASMEAGAGRSCFGVEELAAQRVSGLFATSETFVDRSEASGFDLVDAAADVVAATDCDFDGLVGFFAAGEFDQEWSRSFRPRASQFASDEAARLIFLGASDDTESGFTFIDGAFVEDLVFVVAIAVVETFAIADASGGFGDDLLATDAGAVVPVFAIVVGIASFVLFSVLHASGLNQFVATVSGFLAFVHGVVFGDVVVEVQTFATIDASLVDDFQGGAVGFACEVIGAVIPCFVDFVLLTILQAAGQVVRQFAVATLLAFLTVLFGVVVAADGETRQIFGDASLSNDLTTLAHEDETSTFDLRTFGVASRATAGVLHSLRLFFGGWEGHGHRYGQQTHDH